MGRSWLLEVVVRLFILLINKSVLLIMTTKTKTQINWGYGGWAEKKKTPVAWFSFFFRAAARGSDNGDGKMRKWKKTSWVGRFALNFFRFPSKFYPHCFSLFVATIRARGSPRPLAHVTSGYLPVCRISVSICSAVFFQSFQICVGNFAFTVVLLLLGSKGN